MSPKTDYISTRVSKATKKKLRALARVYGTQTEALAVAIDRLYMAEFGETAGVVEKDEIKDT